MRKVDFNLWTQSDAIAFIRICERCAPEFGLHVALTGGLLWNTGAAKDCDVVLYRELYHAQTFDPYGFFKRMEQDGLSLSSSGNAWSVQAKWLGKRVDFFIPEYPDAREDDIPTLPTPPKKQTGWSQ